MLPPTSKVDGHPRTAVPLWLLQFDRPQPSIPNHGTISLVRREVKEGGGMITLGKLLTKESYTAAKHVKRTVIGLE